MAKRKVFGISKNLNEGISQTINAVKNNAGQLRYEVIPLIKIQFDPDNPRKLAIQKHEVTPGFSLSQSDPLFERKIQEIDSLKSLANSIKKQGVRSAIEVYKDGFDYRLISGERRVLASILAGKEDIQARILDIKPTEFDIRYLQWIENIEREDLSIWERLQNVRQLVAAYSENEKKTLTASMLKDILGCSLPHAMTYLAVLQAPEDIQELLVNNVITNLEKAAFLAKVSDPITRHRLVEECITHNMSLTSLKKMLNSQSKKQVSIQPELRKQGRLAKRVTFGYTHHLSIAKKIIELIIEHRQFNQQNNYNDINWDDYTSVSRVFQSLIKLMEAEVS